ncbi:MAG: ribonuclease H-like domain-containing protein [Candidatus Hydrogenedentes bacterium]|nr:ribonuclease H-like domain-containing protein [Candidatus Hydrogenedentota bacterium]
MKQRDSNIEKLFQKLGLIRASDLLKKEIKNASDVKQEVELPSQTDNPLSVNTEPTQFIKNIREKLSNVPQKASKVGDKKPDIKTGTYNISDTFGGEIYKYEGSSCLRFTNLYPESYKYGNILISDALKFSAKQAKISSPGLEIPEFDVYKAIFIDTETTSCYGGTGTVAFLTGIGYFEETGTFRIEQFFMRDFDEEISLLHGISKVIKKSSILIGYNSKSFDLPLLRNRYLINRMQFPNEDVLHFDLMHVARRFWNRRLSDCSLITVERSILGVKRLGDIPGSLIPKIWKDYITTGKENLIPRILLHNEKDILSLVGLMAWLAERIPIPQGKGFDEINDKLALMHLQMRCKSYEDAKETAKHLLEISDSPLTRFECWKNLSEALKKLELVEERISVLKEWAKEETNSVIPCIELAKIYEHQLRDIKIALFWTETALKIEPANRCILKRKERLLNKLGKVNYSLFDGIDVSE